MHKTREAYNAYQRSYKSARRKNDPKWAAKQDSYIAERKREIFTRVAKIKADRGCTDCSEKDPVILDFDHRNPKDKVESVSVAINNARSWNIILAEIQKCDVRCANCHRRRTAKQQGWYT